MTMFHLKPGGVYDPLGSCPPKEVVTAEWEFIRDPFATVVVLCIMYIPFLEADRCLWATEVFRL